MSLLSGLIVLAGIAGPALGADNFDCAAAYKNYLEELNRKGMSPQRRATLHRWARRVFDACDTGDIDNPRDLFDKLNREGF